MKKIVGTTTDYVKSLDLVMAMYNLLEYSSNYSDATDSLWFILNMKQLVLTLIFHIIIFLIILNLSNTRINYYQTQLLNLHEIITMVFREMQQFQVLIA